MLEKMAMQPKISSFFRRQPSADARPITQNPDHVAASDKVVREGVSKEKMKKEPVQAAKSLNKKRKYAQFHLELGQSDFLLRPCSVCGLSYAPGDPVDEKMHKAFHKDYTHGVPFKGWSNERVVYVPPVSGARIIMVLDGDPLAQKNKVKQVIRMMETELGEGWILHKLCKVYLFISSQRVAGCLIAEPIEFAFKVVSSSADKTSDCNITKEEKLAPATLQFGNASFQREVIRRDSPGKSCIASDENFNGATVCETEPVPAACGVRAIWVSPFNRRKHIATQLLDAARKSFSTDHLTVEKSQLAFSEPSSSGKALASKYTSTKSFLVYRADIATI